MELAEQRRKRKGVAVAILKPHSLSLILCFCFSLFLFFFSHRFTLNSSAFRPVLIVSRLSLLSSTSSYSIQEKSTKSLFHSPFRVQDRVLFPDHALLLLSNQNLPRLHQRAKELVCAYNQLLLAPVLSIDVYDEHRLIARCPLPHENQTAEITLRRKSDTDVAEYDWLDRRRVHSWENMTYAAVLDGETVVVFVKGLNLRPHRESNPTHFKCLFGSSRSAVLSTKAVTAAQEVVRCYLPKSIRKDPNKALGIRVTIGVYSSTNASLMHSMPSVARISDTRLRKIKNEKHELCVCTMLWNQASSLREWIKYHGWLGVERWFIYDNNSDDGIEELIEELEFEDYNVSRHVWPWIKTQEAGFSHCALRAKEECNWVAFMDVDEFFYFPYPTPNHRGKFSKLGLGLPAQNSLKILVANVANLSLAGEIRTACHSFGPSGLSSVPPQGVTVGYTCRLQSPERHKSIVRPDALHRTLLNVVHHFRLKKGVKYMNLPQSVAVINHYKYQVWEAFRTKFYRRVATYVVDWQESQNEGSKDRAPGLGTEAIEPPNWQLQFCEVWDTGLRDIVLTNLADDATGLLPWQRSPL
ncbi:Glycosyltransferase family 92 [Dillenia turbinata]|uniref:Glycosyltransferase family 92 protein n=1 Tax=Dillenia turbinata TaxID=194707 RepID=A0AAN8V636_9MAGN